MSDLPPRQVVIAKSEKNVGLAMALAFFFGPLGLLYSTPIGAVVMIVINLCIVILGMLTFGLGLLLLLFTWPTCAILAWVAVGNYNKKLRTEAQGK